MSNAAPNAAHRVIVFIEQPPCRNPAWPRP
jgi:hypothetical protein